MGRTSSKAKKTLAVVELDDDEKDEQQDDAQQAKGIPLFEGLSSEVKISVYRQEPIEEGSIGNLPSDADEATIRRRWGGGVYVLKAKGSDGKFQPMQRTVTIGGDPKFESKDAIRRYRIKMGELAGDDQPASKPAQVAPGLDVPGLLSILQASHTQSMQFMQAQLAASQAMNDQRAAASAKLAEEGRQRDREFFASMIALQKSEQKDAAKAADPMAMITLLLKGLELGRDMGGGGGGEGDPVTAFIQNLPQIIPQAQALLQSGQQQNPGPAPAPAAAPPPPPGAQAGPRIVLTGGIAEQLQKTVQALQAKGYDAEHALGVALKQLSEVPNRPTKPEPADAAPTEEAGNGTSPRARATRKK